MDASPSPKPRLVFVHGIGARRDAEAAKRRWIEALAQGAQLAGHDAFAAELHSRQYIDTVFAYYGDLFDEPGAQGAGDGDGPRAADRALILRDLLLELVDAQLAEGDLDPSEVEQLRHARAQLAADGVAQGPGSILRQSLNAATALLGFGPLSRAGQWTAGKLLIRDLAQVARYLDRGEPDADGRGLDQRIRARIHAAIGPGPAVVVAHSLGSVVALESLHELDSRVRPAAGSTPAVPLLVTIGSPLGLRTVVWPRLRPQPPRTPDPVGSWLNFWDRDDVIVARPKLEDCFGPNARGVNARTRRVDSDGLWVHTATKYLDKPGVAGPIAQALGRTGEAVGA